MAYRDYGAYVSSTIGAQNVLTHAIMLPIRYTRNPILLSYIRRDARVRNNVLLRKLERTAIFWNISSVIFNNVTW